MRSKAYLIKANGKQPVHESSEILVYTAYEIGWNLPRNLKSTFPNLLQDNSFELSFRQEVNLFLFQEKNMQKNCIRTAGESWSNNHREYISDIASEEI